MSELEELGNKAQAAADTVAKELQAAQAILREAAARSTSKINRMCDPGAVKPEKQRAGSGT